MLLYPGEVDWGLYDLWRRRCHGPLIPQSRDSLSITLPGLWSLPTSRPTFSNGIGRPVIHDVWAYSSSAPPAAVVRMDCPHALVNGRSTRQALCQISLAPVCQPLVTSNPHYYSHSMVSLFSRHPQVHSNGLYPFLSPLPFHLSLLAGEWLLHPLNSWARDISPGGS
jgi:hypothetical protein